MYTEKIITFTKYFKMAAKSGFPFLWTILYHRRKMYVFSITFIPSPGNFRHTILVEDWGIKNVKTTLTWYHFIYIHFRISSNKALNNWLRLNNTLLLVFQSGTYKRNVTLICLTAFSFGMLIHQENDLYSRYTKWMNIPNSGLPRELLQETERRTNGEDLERLRWVDVGHNLQ